MIDFNPKDIHVSRARKETVDRYLAQKHYLGCTPAGAKFRFKFTLPGRIDFLGAAMWGRPVARNIDQDNVLELTRFFTEEFTPKNSESYVLGCMMRFLSDKGFDRFIAYASSKENHSGGIYKATNWNLVDDSAGGGKWSNRDGRKDRDESSKKKFVYEVKA